MKKTILICTVWGFSVALSFSQHRLGAALRAGPGYYVGDLKSNSLPQAAYLRPVGGASVHYRFRYFLDVSYRFSFGQIQGGDQMGNVKPSRNLDFRSEYLTNELRINYYPITIFSDGYHKKRPSTASCSFGKESPREVFKPSVGVGLAHLYFNPYSVSSGDKVYLRPLGTEGQWIPGYRKPYSLHQPVLIYDLGFIVNPLRNLEVEINTEYIQTFTDYLDDVSSSYADPAALALYGGANTLLYAYRGTGTYPTEGTPRGNPLRKDRIFRGFITFRYMFALKSKSGQIKLPNELNRKTKKTRRTYQPKEKQPSGN
jgi:hypothetical protein